MREQNERQVEVLGMGAQIFEHDLARLTDREALLRANEARLFQQRAAQFVIFDDRTHIDGALDLPVDLGARAFSEPVRARLLLVAVSPCGAGDGPGREEANQGTAAQRVRKIRQGSGARCPPRALLNGALHLCLPHCLGSFPPSPVPYAVPYPRLGLAASYPDFQWHHAVLLTSCFIAAGRYQSGPGALVLGRWSAGDVTLASPWNHPGITLARDERIAGRAARQRAPRRPNPSQGCLPRVAYPVPSDGIWPQGPPWFGQARQGPHPTSRFPHGQGMPLRVT